MRTTVNMLRLTRPAACVLLWAVASVCERGSQSKRHAADARSSAKRRGSSRRRPGPAGECARTGSKRVGIRALSTDAWAGELAAARWTHNTGKRRSRRRAGMGPRLRRRSGSWLPAGNSNYTSPQARLRVPGEEGLAKGAVAEAIAGPTLTRSAERKKRWPLARKPVAGETGKASRRWKSRRKR